MPLKEVFAPSQSHMILIMLLENAL